MYNFIFINKYLIYICLKLILILKFKEEGGGGGGVQVNVLPYSVYMKRCPLIAPPPHTHTHTHCIDRLENTLTLITFPTLTTSIPLNLILMLNSKIGGTARCSSLVRAFAHGAMGRRIDPSLCGPIELFLVPARAP